MTQKIFTVEQANRMLPLVRRIVGDIVRGYADWQESVKRLELVAAGGGETQGMTQIAHERDQLERRTQAIAAEIDSFVRELESLGIELKGFDSGLVDFPGEKDGRPIYLCWRLGEDAVAFWHELDAGFAGRRPLTPLAVA